jgi:hypothetical protein
MNIFVVDKNPRVAAQSLCDKHVVKMIVESGQMLSTAHRVLDGVMYHEMTKGDRPRRIKRWRLNDEREKHLWKASFINHPCTKWTMETAENYRWHVSHAFALCKEYTYRYGKRHKSQDLIEFLTLRFPNNIKQKELTDFALAMPDEYKCEDAVESYRNYYNGAKTKIAAWNHSEQPDWFIGDEDEV